MERGEEGEKGEVANRIHLPNFVCFNSYVSRVSYYSRAYRIRERRETYEIISEIHIFPSYFPITSINLSLIFVCCTRKLASEYKSFGSDRRVKRTRSNLMVTCPPSGASTKASSSVIYETRICISYALQEVQESSLYSQSRLCLLSSLFVLVLTRKDQDSVSSLLSWGAKRGKERSLRYSASLAALTRGVGRSICEEA